MPLKNSQPPITALPYTDRVAKEPVGRCGKCKTIRFLNRNVDRHSLPAHPGFDQWRSRHSNENDEDRCDEQIEQVC